MSNCATKSAIKPAVEGVHPPATEATISRTETLMDDKAANSDSQTLATGEDGAVVADAGQEEASTSQPSADHVEKQPTNLDDVKAGVNFTPTAGTPPVDLNSLNDSDLFKYVCAACNGGGIVEGAVRNHRCEAGRALEELFRRDQLARERGEDDVPTWQARCDSIGICRKTAYNLRIGHRAIRAADPLLKNAADQRKIDLFQPQVNRRLIAITVKQGGRAIAPDELPALINSSILRRNPVALKGAVPLRLVRLIPARVAPRRRLWTWTPISRSGHRFPKRPRRSPNYERR